MFWEFCSLPDRKINQYTFIKDALKSIDTKKFKYVYSSDYSLSMITTYFKRLYLYRNYISYVTDCLINNIEINILKVPSTEECIYLNNFFLSKNNTVMDSVHEWVLFKKDIIDFVEIHDVLTKIYEDNNTNRRNLRLTSNLINNLDTILKEILNDFQKE